MSHVTPPLPNLTNQEMSHVTIIHYRIRPTRSYHVISFFPKQIYNTTNILHHTTTIGPLAFTVATRLAPFGKPRRHSTTTIAWCNTYCRRSITRAMQNVATGDLELHPHHENPMFPNTIVHCTQQPKSMSYSMHMSQIATHRDQISITSFTSKMSTLI